MKEHYLIKSDIENLNKTINQLTIRFDGFYRDNNILCASLVGLYDRLRKEKLYDHSDAIRAMLNDVGLEFNPDVSPTTDNLNRLRMIRNERN